MTTLRTLHADGTRGRAGRSSTPAGQFSSDPTIVLLECEREVHQLAAALQLHHDGVADPQRLEERTLLAEPAHRHAIDGVDHVAGSKPTVARADGASYVDATTMPVKTRTAGSM